MAIGSAAVRGPTRVPPPNRRTRAGAHRGDADWTVTTAEADAVLELSSVGARIAVDEVYRDGLEDAG